MYLFVKYLRIKYLTIFTSKDVCKKRAMLWFVYVSYYQFIINNFFFLLFVSNLLCKTVIDLSMLKTIGTYCLGTCILYKS